jgi:LAS superfamily LD-carboxypeptidase LdcB
VDETVDNELLNDEEKAFFKTEDKKEDVKTSDYQSMLNTYNKTNGNERFNIDVNNKKENLEAEPDPNNQYSKDKTTISIDEVKAKKINLNFPLSDKFGENIIVPEGVRVDGLNPALARNLNAMADEYYMATGKKLKLNAAYRSYEDQAKLKSKYGAKAASPGKSLHEFGLAFDIDTNVANELEKVGLMKKYGFTRPVGGEKWHVEPAGIQVDINKARKDANFATKLTMESLGNGGGGWALNNSAVKYTRNKEHQLIELKKASSGGYTVTTPVTDIALDKEVPVPPLNDSNKDSKTTSSKTSSETNTQVSTPKNDSNSYQKMMTTFTNNKVNNIGTLDPETEISAKNLDYSKSTSTSSSKQLAELISIKEYTEKSLMIQSESLQVLKDIYSYHTGKETTNKTNEKSTTNPNVRDNIKRPIQDTDSGMVVDLSRTTRF